MLYYVVSKCVRTCQHNYRCCRCRKKRSKKNSKITSNGIENSNINSAGKRERRDTDDDDDDDPSSKYFFRYSIFTAMIFCLISCISSLTICTHLILYDYQLFFDWKWLILRSMCLSFWIFSRFSISVVYVGKLFHVFRNSIFSYSLKYIRCLILIIIFIFSLCILLVILWFINYNFIAFLIFLVCCFIDLIFSIFLTYLYIYKLFQVQKCFLISVVFNRYKI